MTATLLVGPAQADVIARWTPVSGDATASDYHNTTQTPAADETASGVSASTLARVNHGNFTNGGTNWAGIATLGNDDTVYTEFTLTPGGGQSIDFTTLTYTTVGNSESNTATGMTMFLSTDIGGFGIANSVASDTVDAASITAGDLRYDLDISSLTGVATPVTVRLYIVDNNDDVGPGGNSFAPLAGSNSATDVGLIVNGTVVPEPGSLALLSLGGLFIARRRRA
ncbi:PEP-CTERM sorting domain-containing protein [Phycisphaeraceae bacterium D3-23]